MSPRRSAPSALLALVLLGACSFAVVASVAGHTDDGCAVELHCFACHWQLSAQAVSATVAIVLAAPELSGSMPDLLTPDEAQPPECESSSRGPPAVTL